MYNLLIILLFLWNIVAHPSNIAWYGGPMQFECEHALNLLTGSGQYVKENVIATKAVSFNDDIYVITPRMKRGVLATVWMLIRGRQGPALEPYPALPPHALSDCSSIQNAIAVHLDYIGNLWVLDNGVVDTLEAPRCTCKPKVVVISTLLRTVTKRLDLSALVEPNSLLQTVAVEYGLGAKPFVQVPEDNVYEIVFQIDENNNEIEASSGSNPGTLDTCWTRIREPVCLLRSRLIKYISDAARGAILVRDASSNTEWSMLVSQPAAGLQVTLVKRSPTHTVLVAARAHQPGLVEIDTAALRRRHSGLPLRVFGEHTKPVFLLGSDTHHVYLRHADGTDVLSWDVRDGYNTSRLISIHSPGPRLIPTSVSADPLKHAVLVLDSNYGDIINTNSPAYQRISFIGQL